LVANLSLKTTVEGSGAVTVSTIEYQLWRGLSTPFGGWMMWSQLAATSAAVSGVPSVNLTPSRILKVQVLPPSAGCGMTVHRSQTKSVVEDGFSGLTRIKTL
jgi:hypothetical protein